MTYSKILFSETLRVWWKGNEIVHVYIHQTHVHKTKRSTWWCTDFDTWFRDHKQCQNRQLPCPLLCGQHATESTTRGGLISNFLDELMNEYLNVLFVFLPRCISEILKSFPNLTCFHCSQAIQPAWLSLCHPLWDSVLLQMKSSTHTLNFQNGNLSCSG